MEYTQRLSLRQECMENNYSRVGLQLQPTPTCLGLKGFVVVVAAAAQLMFPVTDHLLFVQGQEGEAIAEETKKSNHVQRKLEKRQQGRALDTHIEEQFGSGRLLACISSRPGQCGRADG